MANKYFFFISNNGLQSLANDENARLTGAYYNIVTKSYPVLLIPYIEDIKTQIALILTAFEDRDATNLCSISCQDKLPLYSAQDLLIGAHNVRLATKYVLAVKDEVSWLDIANTVSRSDVVSLNEFRQLYMKDILTTMGHDASEMSIIDSLDWDAINACWTEADKDGRMSLDIYNKLIEIVERS